MLSVAKIGKRNKEQNFFPVFFCYPEKRLVLTNFSIINVYSFH